MNRPVFMFQRKKEYYVVSKVMQFWTRRALKKSSSETYFLVHQGDTSVLINNRQKNVFPYAIGFN